MAEQNETAPEAPVTKAEKKHVPPAAPPPPKKAAPPEAMPFLGVLAPPNILQASKRRKGIAALPVVIKDEKGVILGVVVAAGPGYLGDALVPHLEKAGLKGPFTQVPPSQLEGHVRLSVARAINRAGDADLDKRGALASFGFTIDMALA